MRNSCLANLLLVAGTVFPAVQAADQPVYIHLFTRSTDHVNLELTEQRLQRYLPLIERYRKVSPQQGLSLSIQFSGTVSDLLGQRNRANHLVDAILEAQRQGLVETAYDGYDEPTPALRPRPNFRRAKTPEQRWLARTEAAEWFMTEFKHYTRGDPDPEHSGGLKRMQEVFGEAAYVAYLTMELGGDSEVLHVLVRMNRRAVLMGLPDRQFLPARVMEGYRGGSKTFGELVSPEAECSPEVYWQDGKLRLSDTSGDPVKLLRADAGPEAIAGALKLLDRSRVHVIRIELGHPGIYLQPEFEKLNLSPLAYAYANPKLPRLPLEAFRSPAEIDAAFGREAATIEWLAGQFFPANQGSRWVSSADLVRFARTSAGSDVSNQRLRKAAEYLSARWKVVGNHPPEYALADSQYFSLAEMFQLLATSLASRARTGTLPDTVRLAQVYGPRQMEAGQGPPLGSVSTAGIIRATAEIAPALTSSAWKPVPDNVIPGWIAVDGLRLNAAQFLRLMTETFLSPTSEERLNVRTCQMSHALILSMPSTRGVEESGAAWTVKPARLTVPKTLAQGHAAMASTGAARQWAPTLSCRGDPQ